MRKSQVLSVILPIVLSIGLGALYYWARKWDPIAGMPPLDAATWAHRVTIAGYAYIALNGLSYFTGRVGSASVMIVDALTSLLPALVITGLWVAHYQAVDGAMSDSVKFIVKSAQYAVAMDVIVIGGLILMINRLTTDVSRQL